MMVGGVGREGGWEGVAACSSTYLILPVSQPIQQSVPQPIPESHPAPDWTSSTQARQVAELSGEQVADPKNSLSEVAREEDCRCC